MRTILACILAILVCHTASAHQDTIITQNGEKLEGLPSKYQPALFSIADRRIVLGEKSVVVPDCIWKHFGPIKASDVRFRSSWYHDPSILPPYISMRIAKADGEAGYELLLNLDTLAV